MNPKALLSFLLVTYPSVIIGLTTNFNSRSTTSLFAKKQQNRKSSSSKAPASKSVGGFGSAPKPASDGKVRTVSGFAGSGTKPLRVAANTFDKLRKDYGKEYTSDVYCKSPLNDPELLWFVGKVNIRPNTAATPDQAVIAQKRLILEYAKRELRPQNLGGKYASSLELWLAPGDSEMDAVQNKVSITKVDGSVADLSEDFSVNDVGYNPEIYVGDEVEKGGLRIKRDDDGNPIKPVFEVNQ
ncbi:unnamed protein product [Cylindrotheca closterium]|uniref:Plastid lipid-associated protein/fibrillin conserved domain-containing protein n=1 Tax=Cylindrotheca closterium TaxID=2856 RepID=A0AAD2FDR5_9STRA|nr:unnamed protein product [Cylindrotheca closterium]